jgi:uncharacterized membrane protein
MTDGSSHRGGELRRLEGAFGSDAFGQAAERFARWFGTPTFLVGQTLLVIAWIAVNSAAAALRWDPYPFILLNLAFSTQAAYAAPLILLAQTRQAERDRAQADMAERHRDAVAQESAQRQEALERLLAENTRLTRQVDELLQEIRSRSSE